MLLELNFVNTLQAVDNSDYQLITRTRVPFKGDEDALEQIVKFIGDNSDAFDALGDASLASILGDLKFITIEDFYAIKCNLRSYSHDIIASVVSDEESNANSIADGVIEYNVEDYLNMASAFLPTVTKILMNRDEVNDADLFSQIAETYGIFEGNSIQGLANPLKAAIENLKISDSNHSKPSSMAKFNVINILEFIGKKYYNITA